MSAENNNKESTSFQPESQSDRWIKYGSNVALSIILVIALAFGLTWFAQKANARMDWTAGGSLTLKPQTLAVVKDVKQPITLVSLYVRPEDKPEEVAQAQRVADLLDEYKAKSGNIAVKVIDPAKEKDKLEDLHQDFINRYGKSIKSYKDYLENWTRDYEQIKKLTDAEATAVTPFIKPELSDDDKFANIQSIVTTISDQVPRNLDSSKKAIDHELRQKHPDYKAAANTAKQLMQNVSDLAGQIVDIAPKVQLNKDVPDEFKKYLLGSIPHYQEMKKIADASVTAEGKLGELKVDQLEQALQVEDPILVLGKDEWRIISKSQVWQDDTDVHAASATGKTKPRFAGEQQITTAIYCLENPVKRKICFVRPGGQPLTQHGFPPFIPGGPLSSVADRLRDYNFDVMEKDLSGQWAMQAQMQQMPTPPEPSDEQIKDALWVVVDVPNEQNPQGMPPPKIGAKLKEHLDSGGSAMVLVQVHGEDLSDALKDWGVDLHPDVIGIHETVKVDEAAEADPLEQGKSQPYVWDIRNYGDNAVADSVKNLNALIVAPIVVRTNDAKGATVSPLLPLTMSGLQVWGTTDLEGLQKGTPKYHSDKGDLQAPLFGGAISEKGNGRLVVLGSLPSFTNGFVPFYDPKLRHRDPPLYVDICPGNGALFQNSVFWLSHMEQMMAISATAMDVPRIDDMSNHMRDFWRIGVLMILLPGLVLAAGAFVYVSRRD